MPRVRFDLRQVWEYGHLDSQCGDVYHGQSAKALPNCANVPQDFELETRFVRLRIGAGNFRGKSLIQSNPAAPSPPGNSGRAVSNKGEIRHAF